MVTVRTTPLSPDDVAPTSLASQSTDTLLSAARLLFRKPSAWLLTVSALMAWSMRFHLGNWSAWDAVVAAGLVAWWPLQEWLIHVFILHFRPRRLGRFTLDLYVARKHRMHHADPWNTDIVAIPTRVVLVSLPVLFLLWTNLLPTRELGYTGLAAYLTLSLNYEWMHLLIHTRYVPRGAWYRRLWRHHRLHHCKSEHHWYGVSMLAGDVLLGTAPDPAQVETSSTCRSLGYR
ncbi:MAG: sterol desaturase family protein [Myxococcota bacterium]